MGNFSGHSSTIDFTNYINFEDLLNYYWIVIYYFNELNFEAAIKCMKTVPSEFPTVATIQSYVYNLQNPNKYVYSSHNYLIKYCCAVTL